ncbi:MAG TPA: DUF1565 domain-containing protein [Candidatus Cloacimonadota bacterium]|nr:DUF1565 domain-containing protein [Candidatus Cloacimonadota bacterium]
MKYLWQCVLLLLPIYLFGATLEVSLDGTHAYTSIQSAINASSDGDIVKVYPGVYAEALETNGKSITLQSLYPITLSQETINTTIIHPATVSSCVEIDHGETVTINGFTMTNNDPVNMMPTMVDANHDGYMGGAIEITDHSSAAVLNCVIQNCFVPAGGIYFNGTSFYLSNTTIRNCMSIDSSGGGLTLWANSDSIVQFDSIHPNSIYNNMPTDVYLSDVASPLNISFATFSIAEAVPDNYYFFAYNCAPIQISVQTPFYTLINHDLYVSPTGNDLNSGLSPSEPFKTIVQALKIIQPDSLNPKTIHLAAGTYSIAENDQFFILMLKSNMRLIGDETQETILDASNVRNAYIEISGRTNTEVANLKLLVYQSTHSPITIGDSYFIKLSNIEMEGNLSQGNGILCAYDNDVILENILVHNTTTNDDQNLAFDIWYTDGLIINNCIVDNLHIDGNNANNIAYRILESDAVVRNCIISNCTAGDGVVFMYQNVNEAESAYNLDMSNMLIFNNSTLHNDVWAPYLVSLHNHYNRMQMNNCTFGNNISNASYPVQINGEADVRNCIFYNPAMNWDVAFLTNEGGIIYHPTISNSLLHHTVSALNLALLTQSEMINNSNPLFLGSTTDTLSITQPGYYYLSANSPCIDTGTADTTGINLPAMDLAGNHRVWNNRIDMGCYEYGSEPVSIDDHTSQAVSDKILLITYPNPVHMSGVRSGYVFLEFTLPVRAKEPPLIEIFNVRGQRVKSMRLTESYNSLVQKAGLSKDVKQDGEFFSTVWDCKNDRNQKIASGLYLVRVTSGSQQAVKKMALLK